MHVLHTTKQHWRRDVDLAGVRDAAALAMLPDAVRKERHAIWEQVEESAVLYVIEAQDRKGVEDD